MLELIQITNDPAFARRCDALEGMRLMVDLERLGKAERQAGRNTFISAHSPDDVGRIRREAKRSRLMVRIDPLNPRTAQEVDDVLAEAPDMLMLPMFQSAAELAEFTRIVDGRVPVTALLETRGALESLEAWASTPGLAEIFVGLNDLHLSMGRAFMFEPLASGHVDRVAEVARARGLAFGFGGIARLDEGLLPGRDVLAEHLRVGSGSVILSRTFHRAGSGATFEDEVNALRLAEAGLSSRTREQIDADRARIAAGIGRIAGDLAARA